MTALLVILVLSGWIAFIVSEINKDKEITDEINRQTISLRQQITPIRDRDTVFKYHDNSYIYDYMDELIDENYNLMDSLDYYSTFYGLIRRHFSFEYTRKKEIHKGKETYTYILGPIVRIDKVKIVSSQVKENDSTLDLDTVK